MDLNEAEIQLLAILNRATEQGSGTAWSALERLGETYRDYKLDWSEAVARLEARGLIRQGQDGFALTPAGAPAAEQARKARSDVWWYWYRDFYAKAPASAAYAAYCERVYGASLCQHGMMDMAELSQLLGVLDLDGGRRVLDLGCGAGFIAERISEQTGARVMGIDYAAPAIETALERTAEKRDRLTFARADMNALDLPAAYFDTVISIDTLYFVDDIRSTLESVLPALKPGGQMGIFFTQWLEAGDPASQLEPDNTWLAQALKQLDLAYRTWDFTENVKRHWRLNQEVIEELKPRFEAEGNRFLYDFRMIECEEFLPMVEAGEISRFLYHLRV